MHPSYYIFIIILVVLLIQRRNRNAWMKQFISNKKAEGNIKMLELAKRFIGKECVIYSFNSNQYTGIIKEVTDGAILVENGGSVEAINLDFVVRIREYPRNKKGKRKSVVFD